MCTQVIIVKDDLKQHKKRMCIDYSQTINLFTELEAYPLPRIDDLINKLNTRIDDMINKLNTISIQAVLDIRSKKCLPPNTPKGVREEVYHF